MDPFNFDLDKDPDLFREIVDPTTDPDQRKYSNLFSLFFSIKNKMLKKLILVLII